jgi:hypothetical protein
VAVTRRALTPLDFQTQLHTYNGAAPCWRLAFNYGGA